MRFDLTDLRLFLNVAEAESITHGAERTHLALASASARIRGMEETLGVPLLERGRRGVRPTPAGEALVHHARLLLQQVERMRGELGDYAKGLKGHVRLLSNTAALAEFLPEALAPFLAAHPNIDIDLEERPSHEIVRAVAEGLADAGVVSDHADLSGLEVFPFRTDRMVLVTPHGHPLANRRSVALREVLEEDFVGLATRNALQQHINEHAIRAGRPLKLRVRVRGFDGICRMVEQGVGLGIVPEASAKRCRRFTKIRAVRLTDPWAVRSLVVCVRRLDALPGHSRELVTRLAGGAT
ncbi:LysR family transcriptional regulator (plasmid) [Azospirillum argentinense]|uniref:LysR family transcriptional regulator n=1 Tax=Azospirillum argentinense TaxID=2970906 RepID=A0A4D8PKE5_9PROT|nr:LysR substrate-binding domain-containing protein [Azospirillum argentinense]QCN96927.1 LysR family transcriptional regulator [Azospirillum argentinense]